jgi:hypothetical protein
VDGGARFALPGDLVAEREALLTVACHLDDSMLALPTRNAGWMVRDVIAHELASDADLIALLVAGSEPAAVRIQGRSHGEHQQEMVRWAAATADELLIALKERRDEWRALLQALPHDTLTLPAETWWTPKPTALGDVLDDYRTHDREHAEDIRLALAAEAP